jgi:hypothetical protein
MVHGDSGIPPSSACLSFPFQSCSSPFSKHAAWALLHYPSSRPARSHSPSCHKIPLVEVVLAHILIMI